LPAQLHIWSLPNDIPYIDDIVILVFVKAFFPPNPNPSTIVLLKVYFIYTFSDDPSSDNYEDDISDMLYAFIFGF
jgi:hypothetical protein